MTEDAGTALADSSALSSRNGELVQVTLRIFFMQSTSLIPSFDTDACACVTRADRSLVVSIPSISEQLAGDPHWVSSVVISVLIATLSEAVSYISLTIAFSLRVAIKLIH